REIAEGAECATRLRGRLTPAQMALDAVVEWKPGRDAGGRVYSVGYAASRAADVASGVALASAFVWIAGRAGGRKLSGRGVFCGGAVLSIAAGAGAFMELPRARAERLGLEDQGYYHTQVASDLMRCAAELECAPDPSEPSGVAWFRSRLALL